MPRLTEAAQRAVESEAGPDWGINGDGWVFNVENNLDVAITAFGSRDNINYIKPETIPAGGSAEIKGTPSFWLDGWPADCRFAFYVPSASSAEQADISIKSSVLEQGKIFRTVQYGDRTKELDVYFPDIPGNEAQFVVFRPRQGGAAPAPKIAD